MKGATVMFDFREDNWYDVPRQPHLLWLRRICDRLRVPEWYMPVWIRILWKLYWNHMHCTWVSRVIPIYTVLFPLIPCHFHSSSVISTLPCYVLSSRKNIEKHTVDTIVSWPNPKQWVIVHTSDLMMIMRQSIYILSIITAEMGKLKTYSPMYCAIDNGENILNLTHTLDKIYLTGIL